jgi:hypothetical protein
VNDSPNPVCWPCRHACAHESRDFAKIRKANGQYEVKAVCVRCWDLKAGYRNRDFDLESLPLFRDHHGQGEPCARCGALDTELHHFAPRALFGVEEADLWPTAWLCRGCHARWHRVMREGVAAPDR